MKNEIVKKHEIFFKIFSCHGFYWIDECMSLAGWLAGWIFQLSKTRWRFCQIEHRLKNSIVCAYSCECVLHLHRHTHKYIILRRGYESGKTHTPNGSHSTAKWFGVFHVNKRWKDKHRWFNLILLCEMLFTRFSIFPSRHRRSQTEALLFTQLVHLISKSTSFALLKYSLDSPYTQSVRSEWVCVFSLTNHSVHNMFSL